MKTFRELTITAEDSQVDNLLEQIEANLTDGWSRDVEREASLQSVTTSTGRRRCFVCTEKSGRPAAELWFQERLPNTLYVSNVLAKPPKSQLTHSEYNNIVEDFYQRFVEPACQQMTLPSHLSGEETNIDDWLSPQAATLLKHFSRTANKSTGSKHPADLERWQRFIRIAHEEQSQLDTSTLYRWLCEEGGWPEDIASELADEYDFGRSLLSPLPTPV